MATILCSSGQPERETRRALTMPKPMKAASRTDHSIDDEAAGRARKELQSASKANKSQEAKALAQANAKAKRACLRIKTVLRGRHVQLPAHTPC